MATPWTALDERPAMPVDLPAPPPIIDPEWYELDPGDGHRLAVTFTGTGRPPELIMGWLYCWPEEDGEPWRDPTFDELRSASGLCYLDGCVFELPPWPGGLELPAEAAGILVAFRQRGAVEGSEAALRFSIATGIVPLLH